MLRSHQCLNYPANLSLPDSLPARNNNYCSILIAVKGESGQAAKLSKGTTPADPSNAGCLCSSALAAHGIATGVRAPPMGYLPTVVMGIEIHHQLYQHIAREAAPTGRPLGYYWLIAGLCKYSGTHHTGDTWSSEAIAGFLVHRSKSSSNV